MNTAEEHAGEDAYDEALEVRLGVRGEGTAGDFQQVGDVNSQERGSGARYNAGKPQLDLIPAHVWDKWDTVDRDLSFNSAGFLEVLAEWQRGETEAFELLAFFDAGDMEEAARVFEYGAQKYAAWNWAKGMPWSVPVGCILRHWLAEESGEDLDPESGRRHWGHVACNVIMLVHFEDTYPEGDDRPPAACWGEDAHVS